MASEEGGYIQTHHGINKKSSGVSDSDISYKRQQHLTYAADQGVVKTGCSRRQIAQTEPLSKAPVGEWKQDWLALPQNQRSGKTEKD